MDFAPNQGLEKMLRNDEHLPIQLVELSLFLPPPVLFID
jgi:hypothetical protein